MGIQTTESIGIASRTLLVHFKHEALNEPIALTCDAAELLAIRLCVAGELAQKGVEGRPRFHTAESGDVQSRIHVESFSSATGTAVALTLQNHAFEIRTCPRGAVRLAARFAYAAELGRMGVEHPISEQDMTDSLVESAHFKLMALASKYLVSGKTQQTGDTT